MSEKYTMGGCYYLYNRGTNRLEVFKDDCDYRFFLRKLNQYQSKYQISILAYCLMPNHFHLLVQQKTGDFTIGQMIGCLTNAFTKTFNTKYERTGVLFEGPTKSKFVTDEDHFLWLFKYLSLNPVKSGLVKQPEDWDYSSLREYLGLRKNELLDMNDFRELLGSVDDILDFLSVD